MLDGVMLLWFLMTGLALLFVAIDIRSTPESPVLKWGFLLLTAYTGVVGAFLYVLGCREPYLVCTNAIRPCAGGKHWARRCIAWPVMASAFSPVRTFERPQPLGIDRNNRRIRSGLRLWLDDFPIAIHARYFGRLLSPRAGGHVHRGTLIDEPLDGRNAPDGGRAQSAYRIRGESSGTSLLVRHVDGTSRRLHCCLSDELVAGRQPSQTRDDDRSSCRCGCQRNRQQCHAWDEHAGRQN